jgi:hypothetical protein
LIHGPPTVLSIEPALALAKPVAPSECMFDSATRPCKLCDDGDVGTKKKRPVLV